MKHLILTLIVLFFCATFSYAKVEFELEDFLEEDGSSMQAYGYFEKVEKSHH